MFSLGFLGLCSNSSDQWSLVRLVRILRNLTNNIIISNYLTIPSDNHDIYHFNNSTNDNPQNRLISNPMIPPSAAPKGWWSPSSIEEHRLKTTRKSPVNNWWTIGKQRPRRKMGGKSTNYPLLIWDNYGKWTIYSGFTWIYPLNMVIFHSYVNVYTRGYFNCFQLFFSKMPESM